MISRTGYTGEHGYEIYADAGYAGKLWELLLSAGAVPCGLGSRDTLRLEAGMPLYGHEMDEGITPLEAGLTWAVKRDKPDFIGKQAIMQRGTPRIRIGLKVTGKGIAREKQGVYMDDILIGEVTSGTHLPYLGGAYAMALADSTRAALGAEVTIDVRGRRVTAEIVPLPFYKRN